MISSRHIPLGLRSIEATRVSCPRFPAQFIAHPRRNRGGAVLIELCVGSGVCRLMTWFGGNT